MKFRVITDLALALALILAAPWALQAEDALATAGAGQARDWPAGPTGGGGGSLSRADAVKEALARNPAIAAAREQVAEAKAGITVAGAWPDPSLVTEADQLSSFFNPHSASERDVGLSFTVPYPNRTRLNRRVAHAGWQQSQFALEQLEQQTAAQTVQAYDAILVALRHHEELMQSREMSRQIEDKTEARFRAGTSPKLDVLKAKVDYAKTENDLIANERAAATARATLNRLLGRPVRAALELTDRLDVPPALPDLLVLEELAKHSRPDLKSIGAQQAAARDSTRLARQYWAPDLNLTLWRSHIQGAPNSYKFDGGISVPLLFWQHEKGAVAQAKHHERELNATGSDVAGQVMLDVQNSYSSATTSWRQAVYLRDELLPEAEAAYKAVFTSYSLGGSSAFELLDAKGTLLDAQNQYIDALGAVNDSRADLERAIGAPLPSVAPTPHEK